MSAKLSVATGKDVARVAERRGFAFRRQRGSHAIYVRASDKARVVIPMHSVRTIKPKTLRAIIQDLKLTREEFSALL